MPRPPKQRRIQGHPPANVFKPAGVPARELSWTTLSLDEFEAIRLVDGESQDQESAARRMGVSRPTVTRILGSARAKIARTLMNGQALAIEGGPVTEISPGRGRGRGPGASGGGPGRGHGGRRHRGGRAPASESTANGTQPRTKPTEQKRQNP